MRLPQSSQRPPAGVQFALQGGVLLSNPLHRIAEFPFIQLFIPLRQFSDQITTAYEGRLCRLDIMIC